MINQFNAIDKWDCLSQNLFSTLFVSYDGYVKHKLIQNNVMVAAWFTKCDILNPCHGTSLFLYPLKTSKNHRFFDVFRGYRKRLVAWNGLKYSNQIAEYCCKDYVNLSEFNFHWCYTSLTFIDDDLISSLKITKSRKTNFIKSGDISKLMGHEKKWQRILWHGKL